jgi:penicillin G amidase
MSINNIGGQMSFLKHYFFLRNRVFARLFITCLIFLFSSCHPFFMFRPKAIKSISHLSVSTSLNKIQIVIDQYGIPFIKANSIENTIYGLGFMHARDRLFQLDLMRHAALGKTAELFGERGLVYDKKLRILTFRLDEQLEKLSAKENLLLDSYVQGINDGAIQRGRSAEHFLLGVVFEKFTKKDVIAIARLQSWHLATDLYAEITKLKIARSNWSTKEKQEILSPIDDRNSSIISVSRESSQQPKLALPSYLDQTKINADNKTKIKEISLINEGASNAWVIHKDKSTDNNAVLMNDPHLSHSWPSNFYLATLMANNFFVTGATFVGLPGILIGASKNISWGATASFLNTQDTVLLKIDPTDPAKYLVDGNKNYFEKWPQRFCLDKKGQCFDHEYKISIFGPIIDNWIDQWIDKGDHLAIQWTGFRFDKHTNISSGFIKLAKSLNVKEAIKVINQMTFPGINLVLADTFGSIAYTYAGLIPNRDLKQHAFLPLDGNKSSSLWQNFKSLEQQPSIVDPSLGYIVTANQNIFGTLKTPDLQFGKLGAPPYRALRIKERIENTLKKNQKISFQELSSLQLDHTSIEAMELSPFLGAICRKKFKQADSSRQQFANQIANFDGQYKKESLAALPYELLIKRILGFKFTGILGEDFPQAASYTGHVNYAVKNSLVNILRGKDSFLFPSKRSAENLISDACELAYQDILKKASSKPYKWRWGLHHYLQRQSPLAKAPFIGKFFRDHKREVSGTASAPMAESGIPVMHGANLRFKAKMSSPPQIFAIIDSGNSGTLGHKNAFDQAKLWHDGAFIEIELNWQHALLNAIHSFELERKSI